MMRKFSTAPAWVLVTILGVALAGCGQLNSLKAKMAFRDANAKYQQQDFRGAKEKYEEALTLDPSPAGQVTSIYFFLANSADNMYKPARKGEPANDALLPLALENYQKATEASEDPKIKKLAMEYLVAAYNNPDKVGDPSQAEPLLQKMVEMEPQEPSNYFVLAKIYEDNGDYDKAEQTLMKAKEMRPNEASVYLQLAGYYDRQGEFDKKIAALQERVQKEPENPEAYYTIATHYWEKAYRDFRLQDADKRKFVQSGIESVDKALSLKEDYSEALTYKGLLLRVQANLERDPGKQQALIRQAEQLATKAQDMRKAKAAAPAAEPASKGD